MMIKTSMILSFILLLTITVLPQSIKRPSARAENIHAATGRKLFESGEYAKASAEFDSALKQAPNDVEIIYMRGMCKFILREMKDAQADFERVLKLSPPKTPGLERVHNSLGNIHYFNRALNEAQTSFEKAIAINPDHFASFSGLGNVFSDKGDFEKALPAYNKALTAPRHPSQTYILMTAYVGRGDIYLKQNKLDLALADYDKAIEFDPFIPAHLLERGIILALLDRWTLALADIRNAIELQANPLKNSVVVSGASVFGDRVSSDLDSYIEKNNANAKAWAVRGFIKLLRKDMAGAEIDFAKSFQLDANLKTELEADINSIKNAQKTQ